MSSRAISSSCDRVGIRDAELLGEGLGAIDDRIGDHHELTPRISLVAWQVREFRPRSGAEDSDGNCHLETLHSWTFQNGPALVGFPLKFSSAAGTASIFDVL